MLNCKSKITCKILWRNVNFMQLLVWNWSRVISINIINFRKSVLPLLRVALLVVVLPKLSFSGNFRMSHIPFIGRFWHFENTIFEKLWTPVWNNPGGIELQVTIMRYLFAWNLLKINIKDSYVLCVLLTFH